MPPEFLKVAFVAVSTWPPETWLRIAQVVFGTGGLAQCAVVAVYLWQQGKYHRERMRVLDEQEAAWGEISARLDESTRKLGLVLAETTTRWEERERLRDCPP